MLVQHYTPEIDAYSFINQCYLNSKADLQNKVKHQSQFPLLRVYVFPGLDEEGKVQEKQEY